MAALNHDYSLQLKQAPGCTRYVAVSHCWSESESATRPPDRPRRADPNRPEIELDLQRLQRGGAPAGWNFYSDVPNVQAWAIPSEITQKWANNLTFLAPGLSTSFDPPPLCPDCVLPNNHPLPPFQEELKGIGNGVDYAGRITVQSLDGSTRPHLAPRTTLCRAMRFAAAHQIGMVWIDKECILQNDRDDKELGIQSMDLVYQRSRYPVGIVPDVEITTQLELNVMAKMMSNRRMSMEEWRVLGAVMQRIGDSKFFTRAWICQELHASGCTTLLISCSPSLYKEDRVLGLTPGEVEIRLDYSTYGVGRWRMLGGKINKEVCKSRELGLRSLAAPFHTIGLVWDELRAYATGIPAELPGSTNDWGTAKDFSTRRQYNVRSGLTRLGDKKNSVSSERLTILANICNFRVKLNTKGLAGFTFSTCLMALTLMNYHWDCIFDPIPCPALEGLEEKYFVRNETNRVDEGGLYIDCSWRQHPRNELEGLSFAGQAPALQNAQPFLTVDNGQNICKGRLWVTTRVLNLQCKRPTALYGEQPESLQRSMVAKQNLWSLVVACSDAELLAIAIGLWQDIKADETTADLYEVLPYYKHSCPDLLLRNQLSEYYPWLQRRIRAKGVVCFAQCVGPDLGLLQDPLALMDIDGLRVPIFECLTVGAREASTIADHWRWHTADRYIYRWPSETLGAIHTSEGDVFGPCQTPAYVVSCQEHRKDQSTGGSPIRIVDSLLGDPVPRLKVETFGPPGVLTKVPQEEILEQAQSAARRWRDLLSSER